MDSIWNRYNVFAYLAWIIHIVTSNRHVGATRLNELNQFY